MTTIPDENDPAIEVYEDEEIDSVPAQSVPDGGEGGKIKTIMSILKKCLGVKDIAAMRISLPASLMEPIPNLEYWTYLDRPDLFAAINDVDDPFYRILAVVRFTFSKDLKFIRGKICKPYNSVLGEYFRGHWDIIPASYSSGYDEPPTQHLFVSAPAESSPASSSSYNNNKGSLTPTLAAPPRNGYRNSDALSIRSSASFKGEGKSAPASPIPQSLIGESNLEAGISELSLGESDLDAKTGQLLEGDAATGERIRVVFLTEQVCHHPPISSWYASCPARQMVASGVDQISARVSGTTIRIGPGARNKGIFIRINGGYGEGERYQITHPTAQVNGILRGSFYATVSDSITVTVDGGKSDVIYRAILDYKDEPWFGKPQFAVEGVIHTCKAGDDSATWTRVKHVPRDRIVAQIEGSWKHHIRWKRPNEIEWKTLIDLSTLHVIPKSVRPISVQQPNESRKLWEHVTSNLLKKEYSEATKVKLAIEQRQRDLAAERKKKGTEFVPVHFEKDIETGESFLTTEGQKSIEAELVQVEVDDN